jgi:hypothetical protein
MTLDQVRTELAKRLEIAQEGKQAMDPVAQAFASGHAAGLEDALKLIDKALFDYESERLRALSQGKAPPPQP